MLQLIFFVSLSLYFFESSNDINKQINIVRLISLLLLLRLPIVCILFMEIKAFRVIVSTAKRMFSPFMSVLFSLYLFIFVFDTMGILWFGGLITVDKVSGIANATGNGLYYLMNFNDTYSGMLTLFSILVGNNWNSTSDMYADLTKSDWPRWYFTTFYIVSIMVMLNIVVSFVLDIYEVSLEESDVKLKKMTYV